MIKQFLFIILLAFSLTLQAQTTFSSFDEVTETSVDTNKPILLIFQGSDWCAPCIKFERNIWSTPAFQSYAEENLLILKADFPRRKSNQLSAEQTLQNNELAERYNPNGYFPFVLLLNPDLSIRKSFSYMDLNPEQMIEFLSEWFKNYTYCSFVWSRSIGVRVRSFVIRPNY